MGLSNQMVKITLKNINHLRLILILFSLLNVSACTSIKMVTVTNTTSDSVTFLAQFKNNGNEVNDLEFVLKPGDINSWHYEIGKFESDKLDKGLKTIILSNSDGCKVVLDRTKIENLAEKDGMWKLTINKRIMKCSSI